MTEDRGGARCGAASGDGGGAATSLLPPRLARPHSLPAIEPLPALVVHGYTRKLLRSGRMAGSRRARSRRDHCSRRVEPRLRLRSIGSCHNSQVALSQHQHSRTAFMGTEVTLLKFLQKKIKNKRRSRTEEGLGETPRPCLPSELRGGALVAMTPWRELQEETVGEGSSGHHTGNQSARQGDWIKNTQHLKRICFQSFCRIKKFPCSLHRK